MKMTRQDIKFIVRECLVEILSEGLVESARSINESKQSRTQTRQVQQHQTQSMPERSLRSSIADKISFLPENRQDVRRSPQHVEQTNRQLISSLTSDPILAEVFADTARNGGHNRIADSAGPAHKIGHEQMIAASGDAAAKAMLRSDPVDVFGDSVASKWAALAFADKVPAGSRAG